MNNTVTLEKIESKIRSESYIVLPDGRTTICQLTLINNFTVNGHSACVDQKNFDFEIGRKIAREDAIRLIWPLEGYLLSQRIFENQLQFMLSHEQVQGMKDAGVWEDLDKRYCIINRMIAERQRGLDRIKIEKPKEEAAPEAAPEAPVAKVAPKKRPKKKVVHDPAAPWGYKKDGTPKQRPGRKAA